MELNADERIVNMNTVKAGFFDILCFIADDEENHIQLRDAANVLHMAAKIIESAGAE